MCNREEIAATAGISSPARASACAGKKTERVRGDHSAAVEVDYEAAKLLSAALSWRLLSSFVL